MSNYSNLNANARKAITVSRLDRRIDVITRLLELAKIVYSRKDEKHQNPE